ncbi:MAG: hypothetical protein H0U64_12970 [Gemmatimonadaceae bacterium]|nr:hypothetical protein [Gemmatimonadaceae bacterium]
MKPYIRTIAWVSTFGIAMGVLEAAVVIYLRRLYFPGGFQFPLWAVETDILFVELWREVATIVMLAAVGALAGRQKGERFAYFVYVFALWDLVYYIFLKLVLDWPPSLLTWDILFLLPVPWIAPVLAPCIVAGTMIAFSLLAISHTTETRDVHLVSRERWLVIIGALIVIFSFTVDWVRFEGPIIMQNMSAHRRIDYRVGSFVPSHFPWWIFVLGEGLILAGLARFRARIKWPDALAPLT